MNKLKTVISIFLLALTANSQHLLNFSIGPTWPQSKFVKSGDGSNVMWNASGAWGKVFDKRISLGAKVDFGWKVIKQTGNYTKDTVIDGDTIPQFDDNDVVRRKDRAFMIPLSLWLGIDPIPQYRFHPFIHAQVGYNSFFYSETNYKDDKGVKTGDDIVKYYNGFFSKFGVDGVFDLGKQASLFLGYEYQIAPLNNLNDDHLETTSFNGSGIRFGISVLY